MLKKILLLINHWSSKLSVWSWQKLWGNRQKGIGYKNELLFYRYINYINGIISNIWRTSKVMFDKFMYKVLGAIDNFFLKIENLFTKKKKKDKKKKTTKFLDEGI
jgi:hypothetical protein